MKRSKNRKARLRPPLPIRFPHLLWGSIALLSWAGMQAWHASRGVPFSPLLFLKGLVLLALAAWVYHGSARKGFSFLGAFPLLWLAVSRFQWELCAFPDHAPWAWMVLFLASLAATLFVQDGKRLIWILPLLWAGLTALYRASFLLPLGFLTAPAKRFKRAAWIRWGGAAAGVLLFLAFRGWRDLRFDWYGPFELLVTQYLGAFLLLAWLGLAAFPKRGTFRHLIHPFFWFLLGAFFWPGTVTEDPRLLALLGWSLAFFGGFGMESLRRDVLDPSWHGRLVWAAMGLAFLGGVV